MVQVARSGVAGGWGHGTLRSGVAKADEPTAVASASGLYTGTTSVAVRSLLLS